MECISSTTYEETEELCIWMCGGVFLFGFGIASILTFCLWMRLQVTPTHTLQKYTDPDCRVTPHCVCVHCSDSASALPSKTTWKDRTVKQDEGKNDETAGGIWGYIDAHSEGGEEMLCVRHTICS